MCRQLPELNPDAVLHGGIVQVDLEPVPDDDRGARQGENVLHGCLQPGSARPARPALTSRTGADAASATAIVASADPGAVMLRGAWPGNGRGGAGAGGHARSAVNGRSAVEIG